MNRTTTSKSFKTLAAIAPDGTVFTRTTARNYTHVVAAKFPNNPQWGFWSWTSKKALADKTVAKLRATPRTGDFTGDCRFEVIEVLTDEKATAEAIDFYTIQAADRKERASH